MNKHKVFEVSVMGLVLIFLIAISVSYFVDSNNIDLDSFSVFKTYSSMDELVLSFKQSDFLNQLIISSSNGALGSIESSQIIQSNKVNEFNQIRNSIQSNQINQFIQSSQTSEINSFIQSNQTIQTNESNQTNEPIQTNESNQIIGLDKIIIYNFSE